jgi:beta-phosphoglucomutase
MTDALLLDFNGVIVDDEPLHFLAFREVLSAEGIRLGKALYYAEFLGCDDRAAFRKAFARDGRAVGPEALRELVARKAIRYRALAERQLAVVPGVASFVRAAARDAVIAVVSGAIRPEIDVGLAKAGIADLVETIVSADDVATTKPDPAGFRLALARLAAGRPGEAWRALVIEDSLPGLEAARAIGAGCAMLTTSHQAPLLAAADAVWTSFDGHAPADLAAHWRPVEVPA